MNWSIHYVIVEPYVYIVWNHSKDTASDRRCLLHSFLPALQRPWLRQRWPSPTPRLHQLYLQGSKSSVVWTMLWIQRLPKVLVVGAATQMMPLPLWQSIRFWRWARCAPRHFLYAHSFWHKCMLFKMYPLLSVSLLNPCLFTGSGVSLHRPDYERYWSV